MDDTSIGINERETSDFAEKFELRMGLTQAGIDCLECFHWRRFWLEQRRLQHEEGETMANLDKGKAVKQRKLGPLYVMKNGRLVPNPFLSSLMILYGILVTLPVPQIWSTEEVVCRC